MLHFYFGLQRCCNFILGYRDVALLFWVTEMLHFYFGLQRCCNFILGYRDVVLFLVTEIL